MRDCKSSSSILLSAHGNSKNKISVFKVNGKKNITCISYKWILHTNHRSKLAIRSLLQVNEQKKRIQNRAGVNSAISRLSRCLNGLKKFPNSVNNLVKFEDFILAFTCILNYLLTTSTYYLLTNYLVTNYLTLLTP